MNLTDEQKRLFRQLLDSVTSLDDLTGKDGLITALMGEGINQLLEAERDHHLGYPPHAVEGHHSGNSRNGHSRKTVKTSRGPITLAIPRDRNGTFTPTAVPPHSRVLDQMYEKVIALYARGMSTRDISAQLEELYGTEFSPAMISQITDLILPRMEQWQTRPLEPLYVFLFLDAIHLKARREGRVQTIAVYTCLGVTIAGEKQLLGLWVADQEGARYWQTVLTDLVNRGVEDVLIACVDGLKGFPEAIASVFPHAAVQQCVIHAIRRSMQYLPWNHRKDFLGDLRMVYRAATEQEARRALAQLEETWGNRYPHAVATWNTQWSHIATFFAFPPCIRHIMYTTNAVEAIHRQMRKVAKTKGAFPSQEAALKALFLNLSIIEKNWTMVLPHWSDVLSYLMISHYERIKKFVPY